MTGILANILWGLGVAAYGAAASAATRKLWRQSRLIAASGSCFLLAECVLQGAWFGAASNAVLVAVLLGGDWWNRRGRKAARQLGAKSRAVLAAVIERAREAGTSLPEGVRA